MAQHNYSVSLDDIKKMFPDSSESTNEDPSKDIVFTLIQKHLATLQSQQFNHSLIQQLQQQFVVQTIYPVSSDQTQLTALQYIQLLQIQQSQQPIVPQQISIVQNNNGQIYKNTAHNTNLQQQQHQNQNQQPKQQLNVQKHQIQQANTLTTYTLPPKDGEFDSNVDDLEDFITATVVTTNRCQDSPGSPQSSVPSSSGASSSGFNIFSQLKIIDVNKPMLNMNIELQQQQQQQLQQAHSLVVLKKFEVNECESANMLVILDNGEQRLIKFKWSKEKFTVQELLYQVGIKVDIVSPMGFIKLDGMKLNYIATVGNCRSVQNIAAIIEAAENHLRQQ